MILFIKIVSVVLLMTIAAIGCDEYDRSNNI
jgi:hypothetical protein